MDELPHRPIIDLEATLGQLGDKPAQGEPALADPLQKPRAVLSSDLWPTIAAHLGRRRTARRPKPLRPLYHARGADAQGDGNHANTLSLQNPTNRPLAQIHR
jgi:hypothetical protein